MSTATLNMVSLPEIINGVPNICGSETPVAQAVAKAGAVFLPESGIDFGRARSAFTSALHMHQPLIPAGGPDLGTAPVIGNLQHMRDFGNDEARYNAGIFAWCYKRMGEFIPQLIHEGKQPRIMLDYSAQISVRDRWCIAAYIRALQLSQNATSAEVPTGQSIPSKAPEFTEPGTGATLPQPSPAKAGKGETE